MFTRLWSSLRFRSAAVATLWLAGIFCLSAPATAQTAQARYEQTLAREQTARDASTPNVATLRSIAVSYENIVRQFPRSGYSDNALWQGAGVLQLAWERAGAARDREQAIKLLQWLRKEYPSSSLARQVNSRIAALNRPRPAVARNTPPAAPVERAADPAPSRPAPAAAPVAEAPASTTPASTSAANAETVVVRGLSHTTLPRGDRITLELSHEGAYTLEPDEASNDVTLTLPSAHAAAAIINAATSVRGTLVESLRLNPSDKDVQVIVRVAGQPRHSAFPLYAPYRLVLDFETEPSQPAVTDREPAGRNSDSVALVARESRPAGTRPVPQALPVATSRSAVETAEGRESPAPVPAASAIAAIPSAAEAAPPVSPPPSVPAERQSATPSTPVVVDAIAELPGASAPPPAPPSSTVGGGYSLARQLGLGVSRIVIDPGHGGSDPGASANGVTEAALVLDVALRLEKLLLAQPGFEVVLTRRTNQAVPLSRRTAIANEQGADLFLSIHANSSPRTETAGVETYYLNFATNPQAEAVAARENASSPEAMRALPSLVRAITMNNKLAESRELATAVQSSLVRGLRSRNRQFQDLGVKQAPFVVLIGAQMPSVLAEIAFLTNRAESSLLKQNAYKQQIAQALCDAILRYRSSLKKVATVTASAEGR